MILVIWKSSYVPFSVIKNQYCLGLRFDHYFLAIDTAILFNEADIYKVIAQSGMCEEDSTLPYCHFVLSRL